MDQRLIYLHDIKHTTAYSNDRGSRCSYHARAQGSKCVEVLDTFNFGFNSPRALESRVATRRSWLSLQRWDSVSDPVSRNGERGHQPPVILVPHSTAVIEIFKRWPKSATRCSKFKESPIVQVER
jgi:hypothetical protein